MISLSCARCVIWTILTDCAVSDKNILGAYYERWNAADSLTAECSPLFDRIRPKNKLFTIQMFKNVTAYFLREDHKIYHRPKLVTWLHNWLTAQHVVRV